MDFEATFKALTGHKPLKWQKRLYHEFFLKGNLPDVCDLPTGLGKTSVIVIWLIALAASLEIGSSLNLPRRLIYIVNRRTVVDQATNLVLEMRRRIDNIEENNVALKQLRSALARACANPQGSVLAVSTLRGELADNEEWKSDPARPAIVIGTIDMIGSKLLFTGYGDSYKLRPYHAGLVGQDALIVHDEAHLTPAFSDLLQTVKKEQSRCKDTRPLRVMELSATLSNGTDRKVFSLLSPEDEEEEIVRQRLHAQKALRAHEQERSKLADSIVELALAHEDKACKVLIYVHSPEDAQKIVSLLKNKLKKSSEARVDLLTGTIRGYERNRMVEERPIYRAFLNAEYRPEQAIYLVSTSAGEVGIDLDADHMVCDLTTLDAMIQRLGRVNRRGGEGRTARIDVVIASSKDKDKEEELSPLEQAKQNTHLALRQLSLREDGGHDASPLALRNLMAKAKGAIAPKPDLVPATDILLDGWALTSLKGKLPGLPEVADYLHGLENELPETYVVWRAEISYLAKAEDASTLLEDWFKHCRIESAERLRDASWRVSKQLKELVKRLKKDDTQVVVLNERGEPNVRRLGEMLDVKALQFQTVVLPVEVGGLTPEGLLKGDEESASDVAEANGTRKRLILDLADGEYSVRSIVEDGLDMDALNEVLSEPMPASPEEAAERIARHYKWQVSQLISLQRAYELDEDGKQSFLVLLIEPKRAITEDPESAGRTKQPTVDEHCQLAEQWAARFADVLALDAPQKQALTIAARWHDRGKDRRIWQRAIHNDGLVAFAKSGPRGMDGRQLGGYRHELGSLLEAMSNAQIANHSEADLVLHLIAAHHGWARPHFLPSAWDNERFTTAENKRAVLETVRRFGRLQQRLGRWGLAWLEALMHAIDVLASNQIPLPESD